MPQEFLFEHDLIVAGEILRFAVLEFTDRDDIKTQYAACIALIDDEGYFEFLKEAVVTDTLEESFEFLINSLILSFCKADIVVLYSELNNTLKSLKNG